MENQEMLALTHTFVVPIDTQPDKFSQLYDKLSAKTDTSTQGRDEAEIEEFCKKFSIGIGEKSSSYLNLKMPAGIMHVRVFHKNYRGCMAALTTTDNPISMKTLYDMAEDLANSYISKKGVWSAIVQMKKQRESVLDVELITQ